jgi:hypothetical protein
MKTFGCLAILLSFLICTQSKTCLDFYNEAGDIEKRCSYLDDLCKRDAACTDEYVESGDCVKEVLDACKTKADNFPVSKIKNCLRQVKNDHMKELANCTFKNFLRVSLSEFLSLN